MHPVSSYVLNRETGKIQYTGKGDGGEKKANTAHPVQSLFLYHLDHFGHQLTETSWPVDHEIQINQHVDALPEGRFCQG